MALPWPREDVFKRLDGLELNEDVVERPIPPKAEVLFSDDPNVLEELLLEMDEKSEDPVFVKLRLVFVVLE